MFEDGDVIHKIQRLSRNLCYKLHTKRLSILRNMEVGGQGCDLM